MMHGVRRAFVLVLAAASCGGSTFSAGEPADARAPDEDAKKSELEAAIDSTAADRESDRAEPIVRQGTMPICENGMG